MKRFGLFLSCAVCALSIVAAKPAASADNDYLTFGAGYTGVFHTPHSGDFRAEYQPADPHIWLIKPLVGVEISTRASFLAYAGAMIDWGFAPHWYLTPSFAPGFYLPGDGKHLGGPLEFRSQLEGSYEFDEGDRLGVALSHESNADIYNHNPGTEALMAYYHMPLWRLVGGDSGSAPMTPSTGGNVSGATGAQ